MKAGELDNRERGVWRLTEKGPTTRLSFSTASGWSTCSRASNSGSDR
jgi:hypothetical protein